jgi:hypothetical protein
MSCAPWDWIRWAYVFGWADVLKRRLGLKYDQKMSPTRWKDELMCLKRRLNRCLFGRVESNHEMRRLESYATDWVLRDGSWIGLYIEIVWDWQEENLLVLIWYIYNDYIYIMIIYSIEESNLARRKWILYTTKYALMDPIRVSKGP